MKKTNKIIISLLVAVLVISGVVLAGQSELFQGRFMFFKKPVKQIDYVDYARIFLYKDKTVSAVTSPVTSPVSSVVVSDVTSPAGTSQVASVVTSPVASAVASAVAVDQETASKVDTKKLKNLTEEILESIAKQDYKKNPGLFIEKAKEDYRNNPDKFTLSESEIQRIIEMYGN